MSPTVTCKAWRRGRREGQPVRWGGGGGRVQRGEPAEEGVGGDENGGGGKGGAELSKAVFQGLVGQEAVRLEVLEAPEEEGEEDRRPEGDDHPSGDDEDGEGEEGDGHGEELD